MEGAVGEKQHVTQHTKNEGWTSSKPEEASRPLSRCGSLRECDHRRHKHAPSGEEEIAICL
jgi:hypothetical protein